MATGDHSNDPTPGNQDETIDSSLDGSSRGMPAKIGQYDSPRVIEDLVNAR